MTAARTGDGRLVTAYVPSTGSGTRTLTVNMARLTVNPVTAKWFNPASGTYTTIGSFANTGSRTFTTLGNNGQSMNDWLLTLEPDHASYARARRSPLPGRTSGPAVDQGSRDTETVKGDALDTPWIDPNYSQDALSQGGFTGQQWAQLGVTTLVWLVAPLIIGIRALIRSEVK